jgi:hypothetical protein
VDGVRDARVSLAAETATVQVASGVSYEALATAVRDSGYSVLGAADDQELTDGEDAARAGALSALRLRGELREYLTGARQAAEKVETASSGPEPEGLQSALRRFLPQMTADGGGDVRCHIDLTSRFLRGETGTAQLAARPFSDVDWSALPGSVSALAWAAASPATGEPERAALTDFLARWADTVFADPGAEVDTGIVVGGRTYVPHAEGEDGARRAGLGLYVSVPDGWEVSNPAAYTRVAEHERLFGKHRRAHRFVELRSGDPLPFTGSGDPSDAASGNDSGTESVTRAGMEHWRARLDPGWGTGERITAFLSALAEHGPLVWDRAAVGLLAQRTGLPPASAALLLAQQPKGYGLDASLRRLLGVTDSEARIGGQELGSISQNDLLDLYREVLPDTLEGIASLWEPGGLLQVAERLAEAWNHLRGRREPLAETTLSALAAAWNPTTVTHLRAFLDPSGHPALAQDADSRLEEVKHSQYHTSTELRFDPEGAEDLFPLLRSLAAVVPWAHAELPGGDPFRERVPAALRAVRARLDSPGLLLRVADLWTERQDPLFDAIGGEPYRDAVGATPFARSADNGTVVVTANAHGRVSLWFRPARLDDSVESAVLRGILDDHRHTVYGSDLGRIVDLLRSPGYTAIAERLASGALAEGAWETDPAASVPELLAEVRGTLDLSEDAARLYLQLLALLEPPDKVVRAVNGWTPARHRKAGDDLQERDLVLAAPPQEPFVESWEIGSQKAGAGFL